MSTYHNRRTVEILRNIRYATVATSSRNGIPWNSPVGYECDNELNIYWVSDKESQHSKNIRENENVFIVIYDSTVPEGEGEGVYIELKAVELSHPEEIQSIRHVNKAADHKGNADEFLGDAIRRMYKAVPQRLWMNDAEVKDGVFLRDYRVELALKDILELLVNLNQ